jgi:hypothetical protein
VGQTEPTRQSDEILPPILGSIGALTIGSGALVIVDFTTYPQTAALPQTTVKGSDQQNPLGQYLTFIADGGQIYCAFASTAAALASCTVATVWTVSAAGVITPSNNSMFPLPSGIPMPFRMPPGPSSNSTGMGATVQRGTLSNARFGAFITSSGSATLRVEVSSR